MISNICAMISMLWSDFWSDPTSASLLCGDVVATILVGAGIVLETPENPTFRQKFAIALVVVGVFAETVFSVWLFAHDSSIIGAQQRKIITLDKKLLAVEMQAADRSLSIAETKAIGKKILPFRGEVGEVIADTASFERTGIAFAILTALSKGEWCTVGPVPPDATQDGRLAHFQGVGIMSTPDKRSMDAARALFSALPERIAGMEYGGNLSNAPGGRIPNPENPRVIVVIGDKKAPLDTWVRP